MSRDSPPDWWRLKQRWTLWAALVLIVALTVRFGIAGWAADSSAVVANALSNASDTRNYL